MGQSELAFFGDAYFGHGEAFAEGRIRDRLGLDRVEGIGFLSHARARLALGVRDLEATLGTLTRGLEESLEPQDLDLLRQVHPADARDNRFEALWNARGRAELVIEAESRLAAVLYHAGVLGERLARLTVVQEYVVPGRWGVGFPSGPRRLHTKVRKLLARQYGKNGPELQCLEQWRDLHAHEHDWHPGVVGRPWEFVFCSKYGWDKWIRREGLWISMSGLKRSLAALGDLTYWWHLRTEINLGTLPESIADQIRKEDAYGLSDLLA